MMHGANMKIIVLYITFLLYIFSLMMALTQQVKLLNT